MFKKSLILFLILIPVLNFAQKSSLVYQILFKKNKFELSEKNKQILATICDSLKEKANYLIYINGHADSDADSIYNQRLSLKRSLAVKDFFIEKGINDSIIGISALGEEQPVIANTTEFGKAKNRRVDVYVLFKKIIIEKDFEKSENYIYQKNIKENKSIIDEDTTVVLENGYILTLTKGDWNRNKECLRVFKRVKYDIVLKENWLKKHIGFKNYKKYIYSNPRYEFDVVACNDDCFKKPIKLSIPQFQAVGLKIKDKFSQKKNDKNNVSSLKFKSIKIGDSLYYTAEVSCPGTLNCGTYNGCTHPVKLKAKDGIKILSYSYYYRGMYSTFDTSKEVIVDTNKLLFKSYEHTFFHKLKLLYKGDTIVLRNIPIDVFEHGWKKVKVKTGEKLYFMFIPYDEKRWCRHYKKYKIRAEHLENLQKFNLFELPTEEPIED